MAYDDPDEFDNITLHPGFVLMKPGSSFYGNGHHVQFNYLAAEKRFINQRYAMTAFPFNYSAANITTSAYDSAADTLTFNLSPFTFNSYQYSGAARSVKDYVFRAENSPAWLRVDTLNRTATEGYLMDFTTPQDTVLRFNAFAPAGGQYVYTEEADDKSVYLTQYDHRVAGTGADLNFTRQEDMGWNMKGLPWLVSNYRTDTILEEGNYLRQMFIPHVFYQMDGNGEYTNAGQIRTQRSWDPGATMSMGHAFLTQTATQKGQEQVVFHLPYYGYNKPAARPILLMQAVTAANNISPRMANEKMGKCANEKMRKSDVLTIYPDSTANKFIQYAYGRDGIKWLLNDNANGQINEQMVNDQMVNALACYLLDSKRQSRISLLAAAPVEVDIPLGVIIPQNDPYGEADRTNEMSKEMVNDQMVNEKMSKYSFSLPEKSAFAAYKSVWLIDYLHHSQTNLLEQDYQTTIEPGENNARFAIRFGMFPKMQTITKRSYTVYAYGGTLYIKGLAQGDKITVYTPSGQIVYSDTATDAELTIPLSYLSGYIVKVNDTTHKVVNI